MKLQMTDEEIKRRYIGADNKTQQIKVLAELNAVPKDAIRDALIRQGIQEEELPPKGGRKKVAPVQQNEDKSTDAKKEIPESVMKSISTSTMTSSLKYLRNGSYSVLERPMYYVDLEYTWSWKRIPYFTVVDMVAVAFNSSGSESNETQL